MAYFLHYSTNYLVGMGLWLLLGMATFVFLLKRRRRWSRFPKRRTLVNLGLSLWMFLAALTAVELYFAFLYDTTDSFNMTNVSKKWFDIHVEPQKRRLVFDDDIYLDYRDDEDVPKSVGPGQEHICFIGDSFTFAQGVREVSDRFSNMIRAELEAKHPSRYLVSNLADAGRDLHWVELLVKTLFKNGYDINTVVYVVCLNDIETFHERHRTYYQDFGARTHAPSFFLFRDTYFFNLVYFRARQFASPEVKGYYSFVQEYYDSEPWQRMQAKLLDVHRLCEQNDSELRIVVFPFLHNLGPDYPFHQAHQQFVDFCRESEIPVVDLEPVLTPHRDEGLMVNRFDAHPNELAHRLAADAIRDQLLADKFAAPPQTETSEPKAIDSFATESDSNDSNPND